MKLLPSSAVLLTIVSSVLGDACPDITQGKKKFILFNEKVNWYKALYNCSSQGMSLATIENQQEQDMIEKLIQINQGQDSNHVTRLWLGGAALHEDEEYIWFSTNKPIKYRNFHAGEPNNSEYWTGEKERCVELAFGEGWGFKWNDMQCKYMGYFACEYFEDVSDQ